MSLVPLILWIVAAACCITVAVLAHRNAGTEEHPKPVTKSAIIMHFISLVMAMAPYIVFIECGNRIGMVMRVWYTRAGWPSGIILIALIVWDLWMMYHIASKAADDQARRAALRKQQSASEPSAQGPQTTASDSQRDNA